MATEELDRQFRHLHQGSVQEFEAKLRQVREERDRQAAEQRSRRRREVEQVARLLGVPVEEIERPHFEDQEWLDQRLAELRPSLLGRPNPKAAFAKRFASHPALWIPGARTVPVYASSVMAATAEELEDIPGERGNPWVLPHTPGHITIKQPFLDTNYGLCGYAHPGMPAIVADAYFAFLADTTGSWNFLALADFHGFYVLNAHWSFLLCRDSRVTLDVSLNAYQYFWFGEQTTQLLNEESDTGFRYGFYDESAQFWYQAQLRADPQYYVFLRMRFTIHATAYHGYAEINFADGANFIDPLALIAWPA
jgi:hypothetical protein